MHRLAYPLLAILIIIPIVATVVAYFIAPDVVPIQVGFDGEVNRYGEKIELLLLGGIIVVCNIVIAACYAGAGKLNSMGMLNVPSSCKNPVGTGRAILLGCAVLVTVIHIGSLIYLLSLV